MGTVGDWMGHCSCFMIYNGDEWVRFTRTIHGDSAGDIFMVINRHVYHEILSDYDWGYNEIIVGYFMGQWRIEPASQGDYNWFTKIKKPHKKKTLWKKKGLIATNNSNKWGKQNWPKTVIYGSENQGMDPRKDRRAKQLDLAPNPTNHDDIGRPLSWPIYECGFWKSMYR